MNDEFKSYSALNMQFYNPDAIAGQIEKTDFFLFRSNLTQEILGSRTENNNSCAAGRCFSKALHLNEEEMEFLVQKAEEGCPEVLLYSRTGALCVTTRLYKACGVFAAVRFPKVHHELATAAKFCDYAHLAISPAYKPPQNCAPELIPFLHEVLFDLHMAFAIGNPGEIHVGGRLSTLGTLTGFHSRTISGYLDYQPLFAQAPEVCTTIFATLQLYARANLCTELWQPVEDGSTLIPAVPILTAENGRQRKKIPPCLVFCRELAYSAGLILNISISEDKIDPLIKVTLASNRTPTFHASYAERTGIREFVFYLAKNHVMHCGGDESSTGIDNQYFNLFPHDFSENYYI